MTNLDKINREAVPVGKIVDMKTRITLGLLYEWDNNDIAKLWLEEIVDDFELVWFEEAKNSK